MQFTYTLCLVYGRGKGIIADEKQDLVNEIRDDDWF